LIAMKIPANSQQGCWPEFFGVYFCEKFGFPAVLPVKILQYRLEYGKLI